MLNTININLKTDIKTDRPTSLPIKLMSQDKNNNQFILRFTNGGESVTLDDSYTVEVLTKFTKSGTSRLTTAKVRQDYATWEFDTAYIAQDETVYNYVYVRKSGTLVVSADSNAFYFAVGLSEVDKDAGRVAETYDENYEKVLLDYSGALDDRTTERLDDAVLDFNQRGDVEIADWREGADTDLVRLDSEKANRKQEDWITPTLLNGATGSLKYRKNSLGKLEFKGTLLLSNTSKIAGIPRDYAPMANTFFAVASTASQNFKVAKLDYAGGLYFQPPVPSTGFEVEFNSIVINLD